MRLKDRVLHNKLVCSVNEINKRTPARRNESDSTCGVLTWFIQQPKNVSETESSAHPTEKRHSGWTIENPELLWEHDQRNIDQTISLSAAYNDARPLFKSALYGIAFVCMFIPRCHGRMCWHRATSGERLNLLSPALFCFCMRRKERREQHDRGRWEG